MTRVFTPTFTSMFTSGCFDRRKTPKKPKDLSKIRNVNLCLQILEVIKKHPEGIGQSAIANRLKTSKQRLTNLLETLEGNGIITSLFRSSYKPYIMTKEGTIYLTHLQSKHSLAQVSPVFTSKGLELINVHNLSYKFKIIKWAEVKHLEGKAELHGWTQRYGFIEGVRTVFNGKASMEVRFRLNVEEGGDPGDAELRAYKTAMYIAEMLEKAYEIRFSPLPVRNKPNRSPHFTHNIRAHPLKLRNAVVQDGKFYGESDGSPPVGVEVRSIEDSRNIIGMGNNIRMMRYEMQTGFQELVRGFQELTKVITEQTQTMTRLITPKPAPEPPKPQEPQKEIEGYR